MKEIDHVYMINLVERKKLGQFFTSDRVTNYIISKTNFDENKTIADISCGDGAFLISSCKYLQQKNSKTNQSLSNIYGVDIDKKQLSNAKKNIKKIYQKSQVLWCKAEIIPFGIKKMEP